MPMSTQNMPWCSSVISYLRQMPAVGSMMAKWRIGSATQTFGANLNNQSQGKSGKRGDRPDHERIGSEPKAMMRIFHGTTS